MMLLKMASSSAAAKTSKLAVVLLRQQQQLQRTTCVRSSSCCCSRVSMTMRSSPLTLRPLPVRFFSSAVMGTSATTAEEIKRFYSSTSQSQSQLQSQSQSYSQESQESLLVLPYFKKVLIANRGEIAIRIARTCRRLNIKTVAVYTYNDTKSIHIKECDESYCIGDSYLNIDQIRNAIQVTKSDAVHPGYGFLSENADFSLSIQEMDLPVEEDEGNDNNNDNDNNTNTSNKNRKVSWLGPPASAIRDMGCKVRSKEIAKDAGINIIPGIDGELQSIENALEIMSSSSNDLEYPILLKAAAGGGGKGMRICSNDQELMEFYPLAQSEGLKYFKDDRLLIEKYITNPHHIEFQVVCSPSKKKKDKNTSNGSIDVAIFPERECSIQRRNQKVIEESPSYNLLTEETRHTMMIQTAKLCQQVHYIGAGTIEWLVESDDNNNNNDGQNENQKKQKFHFLEMNTRLQVEHPITESITNTDLVDAMLRVASGNGLPSDWYNVETTINDNDNDGDILVIPWKGHAIEARIYAEDPLRGYLPSTGPLVPYKEPYGAITVPGKKKEINLSSPSSSNLDLSSTSYLRLDSGVAEGHVVTPFYDPMLSKIISYAPTRDEAIKVLSDGLDAYVIEGVRHNARLVNAVLRHPEFRRGHTPTSFLDNHIPEFNGVQLTNREEEELAVAVAIISKSRESFLGRPTTTATTHTNTKGDYDGNGGVAATVVVHLGGLFGSGDNAFSVTTYGRTSSNNDKARVHRLTSSSSFDDDTDNNAVTDNNSNGDSNGGGGSVFPPARNERKLVIDSLNLDLENYLAEVSLDGNNRTIQVLKAEHSGELKIQMYGADMQCIVQSPREYELSKHMRPPIIEDTSDLVMSPMPGTLINFSIQVGDHVEAGQELCVVEAMKMQNIIRSPRKGNIVKLYVEKGAALVTDQVIMEFGNNTEEEESGVAK